MTRRTRPQKLFVLGLDCAAPDLIFRRFQADLPHLSRLAQNGLWGELTSSIPAITVPAWSVMLASKDPGTLGIYGFRNRADHTYHSLITATNDHVHEKRVWDYLSDVGKPSVVIGVPPTYPIKPLHGAMISCFLTPSLAHPFTHPPDLRRDILRIAPQYAVDVKEFRTADKDKLLDQIYTMTDERFRVVDYLMAAQAWDFFMVMEIGVDRMHHAFWSYHDPRHPRYTPHNPYESVIHDYYRYIDYQLGEWLEKVGDDTAILIVSDHGAQRMDGGICLNEWLWRHGYLVLKSDPPTGQLTHFEALDIDWSRTTAWGSGGYYGRVFLNVAGREPQGIIPPEHYEAERDTLAARLAAIPDPHGQPLDTKIFKPDAIYQTVKGVAPDLMIYFGDLLWRAVGSLGHGGIYTFENDTGPDECNHAQQGMFILYDPRHPNRRGQLVGAELRDIAPTILDLLGVPVPPDMQGRLIWERAVIR